MACTDTQTGRQTDTHTQYENITFPHTRAVIKKSQMLQRQGFLPVITDVDRRIAKTSH